MSAAVRGPAVAGTFYPGERSALLREVKRHLEAAEAPGETPKAVIAPHAGYVYSGPVAGSAYRSVAPLRGTVRRVVLMGPCHRVPVRGLAAPAAEVFETPLGRIPVDVAAVEAASRLSQVERFEAAFEGEHSLEVHLPFLQETLGDFQLVPFVVGDATPEEVAEVLELLWGGPETLIVVSSDLSHYHDYATARALDAETCRAIEGLEPAALSRDSACGRHPVRGLLLEARRRGLHARTLDLRNSGDTAGPRDRVVGYGAWLFAAGSGARDSTEGSAASAHAEEDPASRVLPEELSGRLERVARESVAHGVHHGKPLVVDPAHHPPLLRRARASFVTLRKQGALRGCIGSLEATRALVVDVAWNAFAAAFRDPRFPPVEAPELDGLDVHLSLLSPLERFPVASEDDLLARMRPGLDGLVLQEGRHRGTFLPSVWESLATPGDFLRGLKQKAGLPPDYWSPSLEFWRYTVDEI